MHSPTLLLLVIVVVITQVDVVLGKPVIDEPICTSRYNFESSLLKDMIKLDFDMSVLKRSYGEDMTQLKAETKAATAKLDTAARQLEESQTQAISELSALGEAQKKETDDKINELEATKALLEEKLETATKHLEESQDKSVQAMTDQADKTMQELDAAATTLLQNELDTRFASLELKMEKKVDDIRAAAIKRPVAFLVKTLPDTTWGANMILKFTESIWNTDDVYDSASGYFTAPLNGTYMFSLQLCYKSSKYVHMQMVAGGVVITNAILYETTGQLPCSTLSGVAVLAKGGRVCARFGSAGSSGNVLYQSEPHRWASFMGALVN